MEKTKRGCGQKNVLVFVFGPDFVLDFSIKYSKSVFLVSRMTKKKENKQFQHAFKDLYHLRMYVYQRQQQ